MAHKHSVYDTDNHFQIDGVTRAVRNASQTKTMVVQGDHNSERFTFEIPRYVDAHDMSVCNAVQVHYINIDSKDSTKFAEGVYSVDDLQISPDDENVVICSWLISSNATKYVGKLEFLIRFSCVSDDGKIEYVWNTAKHTNVYVTEGLYNGDTIAEECADVLAQWEARIFELEKGNVTDERIARAVSDYMVENPIDGLVTDADVEKAVENYLTKNPVEGMTAEQAEQLAANTEAIEAIQDPVLSGTTAVSGNTYTMTMPRESGAVDTLVVEFDDNGYVSKVTENGREIPWTTTGV